MSRRPPAAFTLAAAVAVTFVTVPLVALLARAPWQQVPTVVTSVTGRRALALSLECSAAALGLALLVGVPLAWLLARADFPGKAVLRGLVLVPLVLPPVVGGVALLLAFGRHGLLPLHLAFTTRAAVAAEAFVALPFLVLAVEGGLAALDERHEHVAATLGAGPWRTFTRVTLPLIAPSLAAGAALAWARALGEFGATITFAGNLPGATQTLPLAVYTALQHDPETALALSVLLLAVCVVVLVALRARWRIRR